LRESSQKGTDANKRQSAVSTAHESQSKLAILENTLKEEKAAAAFYKADMELLKTK